MGMCGESYVSTFSAFDEQKSIDECGDWIPCLCYSQGILLHPL